MGADEFLHVSFIIRSVLKVCPRVLLNMRHIIGTGFGNAQLSWQKIWLWTYELWGTPCDYILGVRLWLDADCGDWYSIHIQNRTLKRVQMLKFSTKAYGIQSKKESSVKIVLIDLYGLWWHEIIHGGAYDKFVKLFDCFEMTLGMF